MESIYWSGWKFVEGKRPGRILTRNKKGRVTIPVAVPTQSHAGALAIDHICKTLKNGEPVFGARKLLRLIAMPNKKGFTYTIQTPVGTDSWNDPYITNIDTLISVVEWNFEILEQTLLTGTLQGFLRKINRPFIMTTDFQCLRGHNQFPELGWHKDGSARTLFFGLTFGNKPPIYGPEVMLYPPPDLSDLYDWDEDDEDSSRGYDTYDHKLEVFNRYLPSIAKPALLLEKKIKQQPDLAKIWATRLNGPGSGLLLCNPLLLHSSPAPGFSRDGKQESADVNALVQNQGIMQRTIAINAIPKLRRSLSHEEYRLSVPRSFLRFDLEVFPYHIIDSQFTCEWTDLCVL